MCLAPDYAKVQQENQLGEAEDEIQSLRDRLFSCGRVVGLKEPVQLNQVVAKVKERMRNEQKVRKAMKQLADVVGKCIRAIDALMELPSTIERGKRIAAVTNALEMANDQARYFALGVDYRTDKKSLASPELLLALGIGRVTVKRRHKINSSD